MSELMAQYEQLAKLEKEMDIQVALIEKLVDQVSYLEEAVLQLERTRVMRRPKAQNKKGSPTPSLPGGYSDAETC